MHFTSTHDTPHGARQLKGTRDARDKERKIVGTWSVVGLSSFRRQCHDDPFLLRETGMEVYPRTELCSDKLKTTSTTTTATSRPCP